MNESINCSNVGKENIMSDIEEENMLSFHSGIEKVSVGGLSRRLNSKMVMSMNKIHTHLNRYRQDPSQHDRNYRCERELSPMSLQSDFGPQRFNFNYPSSHRSVLDSRSKSPLSLRSGDSVRSAIEIANALKFESFNMHELQMIKNMVCKKLKHQLGKRYEKNRKNSTLLKANHNEIKNIRRKINSSRESSEAPSSSNEESEHSIKTTTMTNAPHTDMTLPVQKNMLSISNKNNHSGGIIKHVLHQEENTPKYLNQPPVSKTLNGTTLSMSKKMFIERNEIIEEEASENEDIFTACDDGKQSRSTNPIKDMDTGLFKKPVEPKTKAAGKTIKEFNISKVTEPPVIGSNKKDNKDTSNQMDVSKINENSMKTSFSKRKLFTQKVDLLCDKVVGDSAGASPLAKIENKEKNKARKLVTTQSCLNRNVSDEEGNVLELIHKIVPPEQINATSSKINQCSDETFMNDVSDTFTDETLNSTIFKNDSKKDNTHKGNGSPKVKDCSIILYDINSKNIPKNVFQRSKCVKSFWDTDIESEKESETVVAMSKLSKPSGIKGQLHDVTTSTVNITKHQAGKIGKVWSVQDLINKRNAKKKTLNISNVKEKPSRGNAKKASSNIPQENNKDNIIIKQNKLKCITTTKTKNETANQSAVKKNALKVKPTGFSKENSRINREQRKRAQISCKNCSGCQEKTKTTKNSKLYPKNGKTKASNVIIGKNKKPARTSLMLNLDTSDSFNISQRTRSKQQIKGFESSKENISQLSDNCNITLLSLRPRKMIRKTDSTALKKSRSRRLTSSYLYS